MLCVFRDVAFFLKPLHLVSRAFLELLVSHAKLTGLREMELLFWGRK